MMHSDERRYYVGGVNVAESAISEEYSIKFDAEQSQSKAHHSIAQPKPQMVPGNGPKLLHQSVYQTIRDRYVEMKRMPTNSADQLYELFMFYRKANLESRDKGIETLERSIQSLKENQIKGDSQTKYDKLLRKLEFEKILNYDPNDVYYTLLHEQKKADRDKEIEEALKRKQELMATSHKMSRRQSQQAKNRLYHPQFSKLTLEQQEKKIKEKIEERAEKKLAPKHSEALKRLQLGKKLVEIYDERRDFEERELSVDQLYDIWTKTPDKMKYGLQTDAGEVREIIKEWMNHNIQKLKDAYSSKMGMDTDDPKTLYKFLYEMGTKSVQHYEVSIPPHAFDVFFGEFKTKSEALKRRKLEEELNKAQNQTKQMSLRKEKILKRPVSATPLSILAQSKSSNTSEILGLIHKYPDDKCLKQILMEKAHPKARRPEEYGIYSQLEEMKIKNRVKLEPGKDSHWAVQKILLNNTLQLETQQHSSPLMNLLIHEKIDDQESWRREKKKHLLEALKAELYFEPHLAPALHQFAEAHLKIENPGRVGNNDLITSIIDYMDELKSNPRQTRLEHLKSLLYTIKLETKDKEGDEKKNERAVERDQRNKFNRFLTLWAKTYVEDIIQSKPPKEQRSDFLAKFYDKALEFHRHYVETHFPVFEHNNKGKVVYSPLLKYEFYKMVKDINPYTLEKDQHLKNSAWTPAGKSDGLKTFNRLSTAYQTSIPKPRRSDKIDNSVWSKTNQDERIKFMMKMSDALECTFKPEVHKPA